jgi:hypothetical protein
VIATSSAAAQGWNHSRRNNQTRKDKDGGSAALIDSCWL